jgi:stage V sporulation protein G
MEITDVRIFKARRKGAVLAYANVILDGKFIIRGITLVETEKNGRFISMPSRRLRNGERSYRDVCHPLNSDVRTELTKKIFAAYDEFIESEE